MRKTILSLLTGAITAFSATAQVAAPADFVLIRGGTFQMGSPESEDWRSNDETLHRVTVAPFYLARHEVTQKAYREVTGKNPSAFSGDELPVESVTWLEAVEFCNALSLREGRTPAYTVSGGGAQVAWNRAANGYRLPTEAEWECAARAGTSTPFYSRKTPGADDVNFYGHYPYQIEQNYFNDSVLETRPGVYRAKTLAVGSFAPNPNGLYDIYGNVGEWCFDYYAGYGTAAQTNPAGAASGTRRVYRGGGWNDFGKNLRSAYRAAMPQANSSHSVGIRLAVSADASLSDTVTTREAAPVQTAAKTKKALIVYYSWGGNTRGVAKEIQRQTGFDTAELALVTPYSTNYNTVLNEAQRDQRSQARPKLRNDIAPDKWAEYDTILIGYPNWWASIPMPIATFLESHDFSGKRILPFCSHGGGRFGQSLTAIAKLAPRAHLAEGLSVHYSGGATLPKDVEAWLRKTGAK